MLFDIKLVSLDDSKSILLEVCDSYDTNIYKPLD